MAFDGWTFPNTLSFIGLLPNLIHEGKIKPILFDYIPIDVGHTSATIAERVHKTLRMFHLETSVSICIFFHTDLD